MAEINNFSTPTRGHGGPGRHHNHPHSGTGTGQGHKRWGKWGYKQQFARNTKDMNAHVFQLNTKQRKKWQFQDTLDQMFVYAGATNYTQEIKHLKIIFTNLEEPKIDVPQLPSVQRLLTALEETVLAEETKQYIKDKQNVGTDIASLYAVTWGQCSRLMQHKLNSLKKYEDMDKPNDLVELWKQIKILGNKVEENTSVYKALNDKSPRLFTYKQKKRQNIGQSCT